MFNAVGIDIFKGKSTVSVLQPGGTVVKKPFNAVHSSRSLSDPSRFILRLDGQTRMVMECTGRYCESILYTLHDAGIFVGVANPYLIRNLDNSSTHKVKSDPTDFRKIARYALDSWVSLG